MAITRVNHAPVVQIDGNTSDGYHTFNELYDHRAKLFSVIVRNYPSLCWKSKQHSDGTMFDGMFIVGIKTPQGQASYHYNIDPYWDMFICRELERAPVWDGHTPEDAINRIAALDAALVVHARWIDLRESHKDIPKIECSNCRTVIIGLESNFCPKCGARMDAKED
ncbi:MAG: hypothetical protein IKK34_08250 [Clostridia bacterium]|nr:hypothetical protein [Clostridia bacterium]